MQTLREYMGLDRTIKEHGGLYGSLHGLYRAIQDYTGPYRTIQVYTGLQDSAGLYKTIGDYRGL